MARDRGAVVRDHRKTEPFDIRLARDLDLAEEALAEATVRALQQWPETGVLDLPGAWLTVVARRWVIDRLRQRPVRAKRVLETSAPEAELPSGASRAQAIKAVLQTLYLVFNEGYLAAEGPRLERPTLTEDAIGIAGQVTDLFPFHAEALGLAALMSFHAARAPARIDDAGDLVPLEAQDRRLWRHAEIARGESLMERVLGLHRQGAATIGPYQFKLPSPRSTARRSAHPTRTGCRSRRCIGACWRLRLHPSSSSTRPSPSPWREICTAAWPG